MPRPRPPPSEHRAPPRPRRPQSHADAGSRSCSPSRAAPSPRCSRASTAQLAHAHRRPVHGRRDLVRQRTRDPARRARRVATGASRPRAGVVDGPPRAPARVVDGARRPRRRLVRDDAGAVGGRRRRRAVHRRRSSRARPSAASSSTSSGSGPGGRRPLTPTRVLGAVLALAAIGWAVSAQLAHDVPILLMVLPFVAGPRRRVAAGRERPRRGSAPRAPSRRPCINFAVGTDGARRRDARARGIRRLARRACPTEPWLYAGGAIGCIFIAGQAVLVRDRRRARARALRRRRAARRRARRSTCCCRPPDAPSTSRRSAAPCSRSSRWSSRASRWSAAQARGRARPCEASRRRVATPSRASSAGRLSSARRRDACGAARARRARRRRRASRAGARSGARPCAAATSGCRV